MAGARLTQGGDEEKQMRSGSKTDSGSKMPFPCIEISGTNYEIGRGIGERFGQNIREGLRRRKKWLADLAAIAKGEFSTAFEGCVAAAKKHFPQYVEELQGWADGAGVAFEDLMIVNMWAELTAMKRSRGEGSCSTISLNDGKRIILAHNEDGSAAYKGLMFWLKAKPKKGQSFQCLSYPCFLPGNSPGFNDAGIIQTTNYTPSAEWRVGVPRYFLNRAIFDAVTLAEAVKVAVHPERGYANHHNLSSTKEKRVLSVEVTPTKYEVHEVHGVYFHTNHLILNSMKDQPQFPGKSSLTRYTVLAKVTEDWPDPSKVRVADIVKALSSHEKEPNSVCRHGKAYTSGATLATAVFGVSKGAYRLYGGNPCLGDFVEGKL
jgi:hypothetical protein